MARCAKLPWQLHLKRLICTCKLLHHYSTSFRCYFSCFTFLSLLLCIPREWDANLHVSIATMGRCSFKVMHPLDARPVYRFLTSLYTTVKVPLVQIKSFLTNNCCKWSERVGIFCLVVECNQESSTIILDF